MEHLALYRKYRPKTFDEVIGQDNITKTLINQVENDEVGHAYLFTGTRGTGKTTCAKIFARAINCLHPKNGSPCGECEVCKALNENNNMDILEIDAASNNGVDEIRDLREKVKYPPVNGKYKVYIIDEVHMLSINAFNALLKTLEEPPSHVVFILATTESYKIPATILSRVMRFDFKLVSIDNLVVLLKKIFSQENIKCDEDAYEAIAKAGEGSVRDTLSIADSVSSYAHKDIHYKDVLTALGISDNKTLIDITTNIISGDMNGLLKNINDVYLSGKDISILSRDLTIHFRNLLVIKSCKNPNAILNLPNDILKEYENQAKNCDTALLLKYMEKFSAIESQLKYTLSERILFEITALDCLSLSNEKDNNIVKNDKKVEITIKKDENNAKNQDLNKNIDEKIETSSNNQIENLSSNNLDAKNLWGKIFNKLIENKCFILQAICGGISNVKLANNKFIIYTNDKVEFDGLNKIDNKQKLIDIIKELGYNFDLDIESNIVEDKSSLDILKKNFGDDLIVDD